MKMLVIVLALSILANIILPSNQVIAEGPSINQIRNLEGRINKLERKHKALESLTCWSQVLSDPENSSWIGFGVWCT